MFKLKNLIKNEFFPSELPRCFNTDNLADYSQNAIAIANSFGRVYSIPLKYNGYKSETSRRKFSIPNPYHYCKTVDLIVQHSSEIMTIFEKSKASLTAPIKTTPKDTQSYSRRSVSVSDTKKEIEKLYQDNRYEIRLDINAFFDNIYTHSIPWAIHGISQAKQKVNDDTLLGNKLDKCMRSLNYNQTNGILVGNAVSRIISEIILCTVDAQINDKFKDISYCRFVDDYYIYTKNSLQIQEIISFIRNCLAQYELNFNENKIQINESPFLYEKPWVEEIKQYIHLKPELFLSKLIMAYNTHKDIAIIKYGLKIIESCTYTVKSWPQMQSRLINLWVRFPSLSDRILIILWNNKERLQNTILKKAVYSIIDEAVLLNREQELVWAVWAVKVFNIGISQKYILKILESKNDLAIILILDIIYIRGKQNLVQINNKLKQLYDNLALDDIDSRQNNNNLLWTSHWLLAYEADRNNWLNVDGKIFDFARKNQFFKKLLENNVKFYDSNFIYEEVEANEMNFEYATRDELYKALNRLKEKILLRIGSENSENSINLTIDETEDFEEIMAFMYRDEHEYIGRF